MPHSHGKDVGHTNHESCPIYQASLHPLHLILVPLDVLSALFLVGFLIGKENSSACSLYPFFVSARDPPYSC